MATELGQAYVQIMPSAKGIQGSISKQLAPEATSAGTSAGTLIGGKLVGALGGIIAAAKIGEMIVGGIKASLAEGADLEQSLGGSEAVFGGFAKNVQKTAQDAYKNMGLSASSYMETANKMGSLFQGSGITQAKSLKLTTKAMQRASDVASVMGVDTSMAMESIAGAAKGNFEMMDNLGVAMNASTLQAYALEKGVNFKWDTASNAEKAQLAMKMFMDKTSKYAGNFQKEASSTYSGSLSSMKASYKNFLGNLSLGTNVLPSFISLSKSISTFIFGNFFPMIGNMVVGLGKLISNSMGNFLPTLKDKITTGLAKLTENVPVFLNAGVKMITDLVNGVMQALPSLIEGLGNILISFQQYLYENYPVIMQAGADLLLKLVDGIVANLPAVIQSAVNVISKFIDMISQNLPTVLQKGVEIIGKLVAGIIQRLPDITNAVIKIIGILLQGIISNFPKIINAGVQIIISLVKGIASAVGKVISEIGQLGQSIISKISSVNLMQAGIAIIQGFLDGLKSKYQEVQNFVGGIASWISEHKGPIEYDRKLLIPHGNAIMDGLNKGLQENFKNVKSNVSGMADELQNAFGIPQLATDMPVNMQGQISSQLSSQKLAYQVASTSQNELSNFDLYNMINKISNRQVVVSAQFNENEFARMVAKPIDNVQTQTKTALARLRGEI